LVRKKQGNDGRESKIENWEEMWSAGDGRERRGRREPAGRLKIVGRGDGGKIGPGREGKREEIGKLWRRKRELAERSKRKEEGEGISEKNEGNCRSESGSEPNCEGKN
jgi:hypothetical protein